jgi:hypothetical protein
MVAQAGVCACVSMVCLNVHLCNSEKNAREQLVKELATLQTIKSNYLHNWNLPPTMLYGQLSLDAIQICLLACLNSEGTLMTYILHLKQQMYINQLSQSCACGPQPFDQQRNITVVCFCRGDLKDILS